MKIRRMLLFVVVAIICLVAFTWIKPMQVSAENGFPLPNFELPYYANTGPKWTGGPHQWNKDPTVEWMDLNSGSGLDFAYGGQTFAVAAMAEGDVIWASQTDQGGGLGIKVAVKHTVGGSVIIYGHLSSIWTPILSAVAAKQTYHVLPGYTIGQAGKTATDNIHLHVELRDGSRDCCATRGDGGNAISWHSKLLNGYRIYEYRPNELGIKPVYVNGTPVASTEEVAYNYDGVAVKEAGVHADWFPVPYENFAFKEYTGVMRTGVYTWLPSNFVCDGKETAGPHQGEVNCELSTSRADVQFAGNGHFGGGGRLDSDLTVPANQPQPSTGSPTAVPQTGNSHVDIYENTNKGGTQYGWDNPTNGWFNTPDYMNDKTSSLELDGGWSMLAAKDVNGGGTHKCLVTSYYDLSGAYWDDGSPMTDTISSVNVFHDTTCGGAYLGTVPGDTVTFWTDPNYYNTKWGVHDPFSGNLPDYLQNAVTSVGVTPGWSVVLYRNANLSEGFACLTASNPNFGNSVMNDNYPVNDNVESVEVFHDTNCGGRMHGPTINRLEAPVTNAGTGEVTIFYDITGAAPGYSIHTDFGDGANFDMLGPAANTNVTRNYAVGDHTITITVKGTDGSPYSYLFPFTIPASATATPVQTVVPTYTLTIDSADTASGLVTFTLDWNNALADWQHIDFGDGQAFDVPNGSGHEQHTHIYNPSQTPYTLSFTVKGQDGQSYVASQPISMPAPTVSLTLNSVDTVTGFVMYTAAWTNAPVDSWQRISFGQEDFYVDYQGSSDTKMDSHIYPPGSYTMTLTVNSRDGQTYTDSKQVVVSGSPTATPVPITPPTYSLTIDSVDQNSGLTTFTLDWGNALADWQHIDFGDGQAFDVPNGSGHEQHTHIYNPGTYTMTFTVKGLDGQTYPSPQTVTVSGPPTATPVPQPTFSLTINSVDNATGVVTFRAAWSNAQEDWQHMDFGHDNAAVDYLGGSGDKTDSNSIPVGTFTFTFTVKGLNGQTYQTSQQVTRTG